MLEKNRYLSKSKLFWLLKITITVIAYSYIYYRISDVWQLGDDSELFQSWNCQKTILLLTSFLLMIFNWLVESFKWRSLILHIEHLSFLKSIKSVYIGITCAIFTPYRIGEYFGRPLLLSKKNRSSALFANILGSISQNIVTVSMGIIGLLFYTLSPNHENILISGILILLTILVFILILLLFSLFFPSKLISFIKKTGWFISYYDKLIFLTKYTKSQLLYILALSFSRYLIFFSQYFLLLHLFDIEISIKSAFTAISISYVFLFSIPGVPIADIGIRGSLALFFIGAFSSNNLGILAASSSLWIINLAVPSIIGSFFLIQVKYSNKNSKKP